MFEPEHWYVTTPTSYIQWDGTYITRWNNRGSTGGYQESPTSGLRPTWESGGVRFQSGKSMRSYSPAAAGKIYAVFVIFEQFSAGYILGRFNQGTSSIHYRPCVSTSNNFRVSYVSANGSTSGDCAPSLESGNNLIAIYYVSADDKTYVRQNGAPACSTARGTGSDFIDPAAFWFLGGHPDYASASFNGRIYELAMYERELTLDEVLVIESTMVNNNGMST
jgi:hypothetical protein